MKSDSLDLRGTPCPLNFIRCKLVLESLTPGDSLRVILDSGEPERMLISGLQDEHHIVEVIDRQSKWITLNIILTT